MRSQILEPTREGRIARCCERAAPGTDMVPCAQLIASLHVAGYGWVPQALCESWTRFSGQRIDLDLSPPPPPQPKSKGVTFTIRANDSPYIGVSAMGAKWRARLGRTHL